MFGANPFGWAYFGQAYAGATSTTVTPPFIASATTVYDPSVPEVTAPFISSATVVHAPAVGLSGGLVLSTPGTYSWICPANTPYVTAEVVGGGGGGGLVNANRDGGGGGGGAYAKRLIAVTPGNVYTFIVGAGGTPVVGGTANPGGDSSFTGDAGVQAIAKGGGGGTIIGSTHASGGQASASTGDTKFSGGDGGAVVDGPGQSGDGGGASGNRIANGAAGSSGGGGGSTIGGAGGTGANGGGSGGRGGGYLDSTAPQNGFSPGGGGGGAGGSSTTAGNGSAGSIIITPAIVPDFIVSSTVVHPPSLPIQRAAPFISSTTVVYAPGLPAQTAAPFIASKTHVWAVFSVFDPNKTYGGTGNGGERFVIRLNANGVTNSATLTDNITASSTTIPVAGDSAFPTDTPFVVTIDGETMLIFQLSPGNYHVRLRATGNTTAASHSSGANVTWTDSYDMGIIANFEIDSNFTDDILGTGSQTYYGWLMAFDSTQGYLTDGSRYPLHVTEFVGVFDAGAGTTGTSRVDGSQPSAVHAPEAASDHCGAALTVPALITSTITAGDVAVVRYTNPESVLLDLGPRTVGVQSWFGLKRVDTSDNDVTLTNPNGIVVDTKSGYATYTGSVNVEPDEPLPSVTGIAMDSSDLAGYAIPTPGTVPWLTTTLLGTDRYFTDSIHYNESGWPIGVLTVRQGNRRVPHWESWDWHNFNYVYNGFGTDDSFAQLVINRNGVTGVLPTISLPGPQDIDGPDAYWDDGTYYFGASWYVVLIATPYLVAGPPLVPPDSPVSPVLVPEVSFSGGTFTVTSPSPTIEGGEGGDIEPAVAGLHVWQRSGGFF